MVMDISERSLQGLSAREGLSYRGHSDRGADKKIAFGDIDDDCVEDEINIKEVPMKNNKNIYKNDSSSSKNNGMSVFGMVLAFAALAGVAYTAGSTSHSAPSAGNNEIADAFRLPRELLQRDQAPILAPSQDERELGIFDSTATTEACNSIFAYKKAFTYDIFTCEKALVIQAVTSVKKDSPQACEHDTGREMELLTGLTDPFDYTNKLVEICEESKRALENSVGCSRYPTGGWHDGRVIREYSPSAINPDTQQTYAANGQDFEWYECAKLCVDNEECEFWTLRLSWNKHCLIRKNKGKYNEHDQHIEGSRDEDCATPGDGHARYTSVEPTIDTLFPITDHGCTGADMIKKMDELCFCDSVASLIAKYPSFDSYADVHDALESACTASWDSLQIAQWSDVSPELADDITDVHTGDVLGDRIWEYTIGAGQMNYDIGQLQGPQSTNPDQITDDRTRRIAADVGEYFLDGHIQDAPLASVQDMETCEIPAMMCCFGRDRQFGDNNGSCRDGNCVNSSPGDNTNVCFDEDHNEGSVHCHGFVWSEESQNDVSYRLRYNNLFFVSLFDHWLQRGYVENFMDSSGHFTQYPMCGCMEKMPAVTRSDCTEAHVEFEFTVSFDDQTGTFTASHEDQQRMGVRFNACQGPRYTAPGEPSNGNKNNDLSSQINKLFYQGKLSNETRFDIFLNHLVGYENPDANHNEDACDAYMTREGYGAN